MRRAGQQALTDRGSVTIEHLIVLPALFALLFLGVQGALYYHARTVAIAAAQEGARAAAAENGHEADGTRAAIAFIAEAGGSGVIQNVTTTAARTPTTATVTVTGTSLSAIVGWHLRIAQSATAPVERPTKAGARP